jgi:uncharacterized protein with ParB-like and HNH nuclease domain/predicted transport protein
MNDLLSLNDLFNRTIFRIPDYQRGYSWGELQLEEFWSDILNLLPDRDHYTGMISLKKLDKNYTNNSNWNDEKWLLDNWNYNAFHIVDGQQRLTTFIILINEIVNFCRKNNPDKKDSEIFLNSIPLSKIIEDYLVITKPDSSDVIKTFKFGYEVDNPSYEFFKHKILGEPNSGLLQETFYTLNLSNAKNFFRDRLEEERNNHGMSSIENIFKKITQQLKFNMYYIDNDFNVFVAFETMNNRGKRLSNLELLKNRLIYLSTIFDDEDDIKNRIRKDINDTWKDIYGYLGKNKNKPLNDEDFLQDHWIIYFGYTRSNKITYSSFLLNDYFNQNNISDKYISNGNFEENENISEQDIDIADEDDVSNDITINKKEKLTLGAISKYINSLKSLIPYWYIVQNPEDSELSSDVKEMLKKLNRLQFVYFKPLITVLLSKKNLSDSDKVFCLKKIERYIFLHFRLVNYQSTYRNSFFWNLAHKFYIDEVSLEEVINELDKIDYLSDNKVANMNGILNNINRLFKNYKGYYSWPAKTYFLYEYELYLMNNQANQKIYPDNLFKKDEKDKVSIEHIYPQTDTNEYWVERFGNYTETEQKCLNGSLGNLLPLSLSINIKLQNYSFDDKKLGKDRTRGYLNGSHSEMKVAQNNEWTPNEILQRGLEMINFMEERYDFIVPNKADRERMLGLDFMISEDDENSDVTEPINHEVQTTTSKAISYSEEDFERLSSNTNSNLISMYKELDSYILSLNDDIQRNSTKHYISYTNGKSFVEFHFWKESLFLTMMSGEYNDPEHKIQKLDDRYKWSNMNRLDIFENDDLEYIKNLLKQSYEKTLK